MYPNNSNGNNTNPISDTHYFCDITPNSKQEDHPPSSPLFYLPSPYIPYDDNILHDLFLQQQPLTAVEGTASEEVVMVDSIKNNRICQHMPRKRSSKKDRHSKIDTAQGPRDRRMRLSLKVAGEFFGLQDMLGFDKGSKTVEWLLNKSKTAIKELTKGFPHMKQTRNVGINSASSASDCEDVSGIDDAIAVDANQQVRSNKGKPSKEKKMRPMRKSAFDPLAKESREKARARARERTRAKRSKLSSEAMNHDMMNRLGSSSTFENGDGKETGTQSHKINQSLDVPPGIEDLSSSIIFNYDHHNPGISQEHQFTGFQVYGKPWEAYNNINLC
ncbi:hypothetical protein ACSBR2_024231 [Camellia fascicularis]